MIEKIRRLLPSGFRKRLKNATTLSYLIAPLYGYLMLPRFDGTALIFGEGVKFFVHPDISAIDCLREIFRHEIYERYYKPKSGDVVIDVGANVGMFAVKAGWRGCSVISIEPSPQNVELLKRNISLHNVSCNNCPKAVSNFSGRSKFLITPVSGQHRFHLQDDQDEKVNEIEVDVDTLDNICTELKIYRIDLLKIDVEGAELKILEGAKESLKVTKNIAMELHYGDKGEEVTNFLEEMGFEVSVAGNMLYAINTSIR